MFFSHCAILLVPYYFTPRPLLSLFIINEDCRVVLPLDLPLGAHQKKKNSKQVVQEDKRAVDGYDEPINIVSTSKQDFFFPPTGQHQVSKSNPAAA